jgi:hypothetical protein
MFGHFRTNIRILVLIRLELRNLGDKIAVAMAERIGSTAASNKPELLDQMRDVVRRKHR